MRHPRKPGVNPFITLDDPEGKQAPPEYWARAATPQPAAQEAAEPPAPGLEMVPPVHRSRLIVNDELAFNFTTPRPGMWRRFCTWVLLGWRWRQL